MSDIMPNGPLALAKSIENVRQERRNLFPSSFFDEHAWDFLLLLFIAAEEGREMTRDDAIGSVVGSGDLLDRWLKVLLDEGAIEPVGPNPDIIRLSGASHQKMREALSVQSDVP